MSPALSLDDAWAKLRWAEEHYEVLRSEIEPFQQRDDHRITVDVDTDTGEYVFHVHDLPRVDDDWGLRIGDCIHNARTALDYLMVRLIAYKTGRDPMAIDERVAQFPAYTDADAFYKQFTVETVVKGKMLLSGHHTCIQHLQPFNAGDPSVWGVAGRLRSPLPVGLRRLSDLDNVDKHRAVLTSWLGGTFESGSPRCEMPTGYRFVAGNGSFAPLENDAEIGRWRFATPLPSEWQPTQMDMKRSFPLEVSVGDPLPFKAVLEVLPLCLWTTRAILTIFQPVFSHGGPSLPVTAVGDPPPLQ
jgi:hypothetical protein